MRTTPLLLLPAIGLLACSDMNFAMESGADMADTGATAVAAFGRVGWPVATGLVIAGVTIVQNAHGVREEADEIRYQRDHDQLTGLLNRRGLLEQIDSLGSEPMTVVMVDADRFKMINDTYGYAAGDAMLCAVADELTARLGGDWLIARQGGDEFAAATVGRVAVPRSLAALSLIHI